MICYYIYACCAVKLSYFAVSVTNERCILYTIRVVVCFTLIMYRTYYVNLALKHQTSQLSQSDQNENGNIDSTCLELLTFIVRLVSNAIK